MSAGVDIHMERALELARRFAAASGLEPGGEGGSWWIVGSIRRGERFVHDIEVLVPAAAAEHDALHGALRGLVDRTGAFGAGELAVSATRGLKPGFLAASLQVQEPRGPAVSVQVYRYIPENTGWMLLMRTGPTEFGRYFLWRWKRVYNLGPGEPACMNNRLMTLAGPAAVRCESEAFRMCDLEYVEPCRRREFIERLPRGRW